MFSRETSISEIKSPLTSNYGVHYYHWNSMCIYFSKHFLFKQAIKKCITYYLQLFLCIKLREFNIKLDGIKIINKSSIRAKRVK